MVRFQSAFCAAVDLPNDTGGVAHNEAVRGLVEGRRRERQARRRVFDIIITAEPLARLGHEVAVSVREHGLQQQRFWESSTFKAARGRAAPLFLQARVNSSVLVPTCKPKRIGGEQVPSIRDFKLAAFEFEYTYTYYTYTIPYLTLR